MNHTKQQYQRKYIMKSNKLRKMHKAICQNKSRITMDKHRISDMQQKVNDAYDWFKPYKKFELSGMNMTGKRAN